jgi:hypothetical protein
MGQDAASVALRAPQEERARAEFHAVRWEWRQATREGGSPLLQRLGTSLADYAHAKMLVSGLFRN